MPASDLSNEIVVTDYENIEQIVGLIHDEFFDPDDVNYDSENKVLLIPFCRTFHGKHKRQVKRNLFRTLWEVLVLRCTLTIKHVKSYTLVDKQHVSLYPFDTIEYDTDTGKITISTCIPLQLDMIVTDFQIEYSEQGFRGRAQISDNRFPFVGTSGPRFLPD